MKVSVIGAGNVGAMAAMRIVENDLADVVLLDIVEGFSEGKVLDILTSAPILGYHNKIVGTNDYREIVGSDIVVITAGLSRKPGMKREDLLDKNASIVKDIISKVVNFCPDSIIIMVTNPLDAMTYLAYKLSKFEPNKVFGMAGVLDSARFGTLIAEELNVPVSCIQAIVLGAHDDTMVPLPRHSTVSGKPLVQLLSKDRIDGLIKKTREVGTKIVSLLGSGSAYHGPSASVYYMVKSIIKDEKKVIPTSTYLSGQYGLEDVCIGVPSKIGRKGVEEVIELELNEEERVAFEKSAKASSNFMKQSKVIENIN